MSENPKHVTIRLRVLPELRDKIAESAKANNRSMNADMNLRLEQSFELINDIPDDTFVMTEKGADNFKKIIYEFVSDIIKGMEEQGIDNEVISKVISKKNKTPE